MGDVYRAIDVRLNRHVALKVLPPEFLADSERRRRFTNEAQAASVLDHPNIVTIHDIVDSGQHVFIVMQYVDGRTLSELVREGPLDLSRTIDYAIQIADGLVRAHGAGVVHRDLKPDNVMLTASGQVKILDFGLAKLVEPQDGSDAPTLDRQTLTREGMILGTASYMSVEQAQGKKVDARSDVFSFGSVLYELLCGRRAFEGTSALATLASIARDEPRPLRERLPSIPVEVEQIVEKCMKKKPEDRYGSMVDLRSDLLELKGKHGSGALTPADQAEAMRPTMAPRTRWILAGALALALGCLTYWIVGQPPRVPPRVVVLTDLEGDARSPTFHPDGTQVAFTWTGAEGGSPNLYIMLTGSGSGEPLRLTTDDANESSPSWSPDGARIAFLRRGDEGNVVFTVPALGGAPRKLVSTASISPGLSYAPGGGRLAFVKQAPDGGADAIFLLSMDAGDEVQISFPPESSGGDRLPAYSPDGRRVAFVRRARGGVGAEVFVADIGDGDAESLTGEDAPIDGVGWLDDDTVLFSSDRGDGWKLWRVRARGGRADALDAAGTGAHAPSSAVAFDANSDGTNDIRLIYEREDPTGRNLVLIDHFP